MNGFVASVVVRCDHGEPVGFVRVFDENERLPRRPRVDDMQQRGQELARLLCESHEDS